MPKTAKTPEQDTQTAAPVSRVTKSQQDKKTAITAFKRKVTYASTRAEVDMPMESDGLTKGECKTLLKDWGHLDA